MSISEYKSPGRLEHILRSGEFAVTAELNPPDSADPEEVYAAAAILADVSDAINATDGSGANCHMSSMAICSLLTRLDYATIMQISCRDRNRIAMQGEILGGAAMGVMNMLMLTGDDVTAGDQPQAKRVFDFDCMQLLRTARIMRDEGQFLSGRKLTTPPKVFLGAAANPFVPPFDWRPMRLAKKIEAGADFIQTQYCYDIPRLKEYMKRVCDLGLDEKVFILIGVGPIKGPKTAEFMRTKVPGVHIPDSVIDRFKGVKGRKATNAVGQQIAVDIIQEVREIPGVHGIHMMAYKQEEIVGEILESAGLLPRPFRLNKPEINQETFAPPAIQSSFDTYTSKLLAMGD